MKSKKNLVVPDMKDKPDPPPMPPTPRMKLNQKSIARIFDLWGKRYEENPENFAPILIDGVLVEDYGELCSVYFQMIADELGV
jgi:hypothetical protein